MNYLHFKIKILLYVNTGCQHFSFLFKIVNNKPGDSGQVQNEDEEKNKRRQCRCPRMFNSLERLYRGWPVYASYNVLHAGIALACLYMTVLGFDSVTIGNIFIIMCKDDHILPPPLKKKKFPLDHVNGTLLTYSASSLCQSLSNTLSLPDCYIAYYHSLIFSFEVVKVQF